MPRIRCGRGTTDEEKMSGVWIYLKRSMNCKSSKSTDACDPKRNNHKNRIRTKKPNCSPSSGCSSSLSNPRDVITVNRNERSSNQWSVSSPRSMESSDLLNPIKYDVITNGSNKCQLRADGFSPYGLGRPDPEGSHMMRYSDHKRTVSTPSKKLVTGNWAYPQKFARPSLDPESRVFAAPVCRKCNEKFKDLEAVEAHHLSKHAVTELVEGDSSRKIVEMICNSSFSGSEKPSSHIERILKVHNLQMTIACFEDYREMVKIKASKLPKRHPRCLADGNELLRFHGTTVTCSLGMSSSSSLCISDECGVCRTLRRGFYTTRKSSGCIGVFTASTSGRALESIEINRENQNALRALMLCRVIAGRVHRPLENLEEMSALSGFDSVVGKMGRHSNIEELYLLNPKALLPCFVVILRS